MGQDDHTVEGGAKLWQSGVNLRILGMRLSAQCDLCSGCGKIKTMREAKSGGLNYEEWINLSLFLRHQAFRACAS